jgi:hypothetical protein
MLVLYIVCINVLPAACFLLVAFLAYPSSPKMEAICFFETFVNLYQITWPHIPEGSMLQTVSCLECVKGSSVSATHFSRPCDCMAMFVIALHLTE